MASWRTKFFRLWVPQRAAEPVKPRPKVIGIGLPKTGTTTLGKCFQLLGMSLLEFSPVVVGAMMRDDLEAVYAEVERHDAMEDFPFFFLMEQLDRRFPGSKFILTTRSDDEIWVASSFKHDAREHENPAAAKARALTIDYFTRQGWDLDEPEKLHSRHNQFVQTYFERRPNDLLTVCWENGDGWEKICRFLKTQVPAGVPFPHENQAPSEIDT